MERGAQLHLDLAWAAWRVRALPQDVLSQSLCLARVFRLRWGQFFGQCGLGWLGPASALALYDYVLKSALLPCFGSALASDAVWDAVLECGAN